MKKEKKKRIYVHYSSTSIQTMISFFFFFEICLHKVRGPFIHLKSFLSLFFWGGN